MRELTTSDPIMGTTCVDNLAKDNTKYYYVVIAIDAFGQQKSLSSHEAPAEVPGEKQHGSVPPDFPLPAPCRK